VLWDEFYRELGLMDVGSLGMTEHRYTIGDLVRVRTNVSMQAVQGSLKRPDRNGTNGIYEITSLLPELGSGEPQYQVTSCVDQADYVVRESQLIGSPLPPPFHR
jgi:hypothetical protein